MVHTGILILGIKARHSEDPTIKQDASKTQARPLRRSPKPLTLSLNGTTEAMSGVEVRTQRLGLRGLSLGMVCGSAFIPKP